MSKTIRLANPRLITGIVGREIVKDPYFTLSKLYNTTLDELKTLPESYPYRVETERLTKERMSLLEKAKSVVEFEKALNARCIENVIQEAKSELLLIRKLPGWAPWEGLVENAPEEQWKWPIV